MKKIFLHIADGILDAPLFLGLPDPASADLEAVMAGQIQIMRVECNGAGGPVQHRDFAVVHPDLLGHAIKIFEGVLMTAQKVLQRFSEGKLQVDLATVCQHHDEEGESAASAADRDQTSITPIDLGAFSGLKVQRQESGFWLGPHLAHEPLENGIAAWVAAFFELLENLLSGIIVTFQEPNNLPFEGIELTGPFGRSGLLKRLPLGPFSDRFPIEL